MFLFPLIETSPSNPKIRRHIIPKNLQRYTNFPIYTFAGVPIDDMYPHLEIEA